MIATRMAAVLTALVSAALCQAPATLDVHGLSNTSVTLSASDLSKLPQKTVRVDDHGVPVTFQGVAIGDVLAKVRTPTGDAFNKTVASYYVIAEARDEYRAVFAWPEVDASFTDRLIYIVSGRNGKELSESEGPLELVAPGDKRHSRWVRQLKALRVEALPTSTAYDSEGTRWIAAGLTEMQTIKPGMTRADLLKVFMEEGGISSRRWRRYVYRKCGYIKVDVEFEPVGDPGSLGESAEDRITKISKPYLQWFVAD